MARQLREYRQSHKAQLIRAQRTSQATIDSFPEPVLVVDPERRVEMANPAARGLFGLPRQEDGALPIRDGASATLGAAVLLENVTRFRLLDEIKSNMVATVSHELKTPLTSIRLVLHLLLEEQAGPLQPKQLELLIDARDNAERLLTM